MREEGYHRSHMYCYSSRIREVLTAMRPTTLTDLEGFKELRRVDMDAKKGA